MAFQRVPFTVEIDVIYNASAEAVQNVFYAQFPGGYGQSDLDALAVRVDTRVAANWPAQQAPEAIYQRVEVHGLNAENDLVADFSSGTQTGTQLTAILPNNVSVAVKKTSGLSGRSARGRTFWIGAPQGQLSPADENTFLLTYVTAVVDAITQIREGIQSLAGWDAVLVSRFAGGVKRPEGVTFPWIGEVSVDARVDSQRGRLPT